VVQLNLFAAHAAGVNVVAVAKDVQLAAVDFRGGDAQVNGRFVRIDPRKIHPPLLLQRAAQRGGV
jgi:hypothetical protein